MHLTRFLSQALCALLAVSSVSAATPRARAKRNDDNGFVTVKGNNFTLNGKDFAFLGTNAYWLPTVKSDNDIKKTLQEIKKNGIKVVRTWAFNDVSEIPADGSVWFQLIKNGHQTLNEGPDGLQRLDKVVEFAEKEGLKVLLSLTNNWNPIKGEEPHKGKKGLLKRHNDPRPRNTLSNDYGGADAYVREFGSTGHHSEFYTNPLIISKFTWYTTQIIKRYKHSKAVFAWEVANDARCASSLPASKDCNTLTVTDWVDALAKHVKSVDEHHLVSSGAHGFLCHKCPKRFSPKHKSGKSKRMELDARQFNPSVESAFDGSHGVDSEDIAGSPNIDMTSFQLLPDMNNYGPTDPSADDFTQALAIGESWLRVQSDVATAVGKPSVLGSFGIVTEENLPFFVPVNSTEPTGRTDLKKRQSAGVTSAQEATVFSTWATAGATFGINGVGHNQWEQPLSTGASPNDGYPSRPPPPAADSRFA